MRKLPPPEKAAEAYSAIADGRVTLFAAEERAEVISSDGEKKYAVAWRGNVYTSTDNATRWQGYAGYPVLAVLMLQGRLPLDREVAALFSGINWTELNRKHRRDYAAALDAVVRARNMDAAAVRAAMDQVFERLSALDVEIRRSLGR
ncbi:hypothetical protein [Pyramidobacter piscolens]|jgi:hypothetical protein|uniref:Uncharacterized protein n=1 Tax=Pyramidobacter piscolens W5455 TaxID=352165 RepID=A0ABP2HUD6_9BACT|nr:hypothetical protein [Pyramidobacter piscolens]EFB90826.1 hypothetical protein HMPREF7215_1143 [Pyramidobacter piscolens W5455]BDF77611.1 hypothetical protein CE91St28_04050 [Pyramidobacter piscolens]